MPLASFTERRNKLRALFNRDVITSPASVFDAVSARMAQGLGFEYGLLGGSVASYVVLGAPDIIVLTLTEFVEQCRRITRASDLPLVVDADHGYGNAMNTRRTIEELEAAGVAGLTIEDTVLPRPYGGGPNELIPVDEFRDKLRGAVDARIDPSFMIIGRTAIRSDEETIARARACKDAGCDAIFVNGRGTLDLIEAVYRETGLPLIANRVPGTKEELFARGVRVQYLGHQPYYVMLKALQDAYVTLKNGGTGADLAPLTIAGAERDTAFADREYTRARAEYLRDELTLSAPE